MKQQDKIEVLEYLNKSSERFNEMVQEVTARALGGQMQADINPFTTSEKVVESMGNGIKLDAKIFMRQQLLFLEKQQKLWQNATCVMMGEDMDALIMEEDHDTRFADADWQGNPVFHYVKQAYLLNAEYLNQMVEAFEFEDKKVAEQVRFYTRQLVSSMAPTNYVFTNPEVCREILATEGECLAKGIDNFIRDLESSPSEAFRITQVGLDAFTLGKTLAYTPGQVVFRNALIEIIQYKPTTEQVHEVPLLIVPPFINKYYILDLNEKKSLVKWLVDQGFSLYMVSWVNPGESSHDISFEDYVNDGVVAALDVVERISQVNQINVAGYCVGGTLLGITQAYLAARGDQRIKSLTFLTTLFDFSEPGEVGNYISDQLLPVVEKNIIAKGFLDGRILALSFSLLRENNLFWSFFVENYLKGKDPIPFDILYWNSDSTNIPGDAFLFYLYKTYVENVLIEPGGIQINGEDIDLSKIDVPSYCLAAMADHIVLWQAAYRSAQCLGGDVRFVLTESGHVAGVVNPAAKGKYGHWTNDARALKPDAWLADAKLQQGSWWNDWHHWLLQHSGGVRSVSAELGSQQYPPLCDAPGDYVKVRLDGKLSSKDVVLLNTELQQGPLSDEAKTA